MQQVPDREQKKTKALKLQNYGKPQPDNEEKPIDDREELTQKPVDQDVQKKNLFRKSRK